MAKHVEDAGFTKADLARKLKRPYLNVMRLLNGDTDLSAEDMVDIAEVLGRPVADLYHLPAKRKQAS